jgi:DNA polymerase-3 subunit delta'
MMDVWNKLFEQVKVKEILTRIFDSRRVPHAFLFYGQEGVGKFFTAIQFAKLLNSKHDQSTNEIIGKRISALQEPFIKLILPLPRGKSETGDDSSTEKLSNDIIESILEEVGKKRLNPYYRINIENANTIKINSIRDIKKFVNINIDEMEYRFIIISDAHLMNEQAQNALLKNLEEPPEKIIFILITSDKNKLLSTIQSRCWQIQFEPLSNVAIKEILESYFFIKKEIVEKVIPFVEGSPLDAIDLIQNDFEIGLEKTVSFLRYSLAKRYNSAHRELIAFSENNVDNSLKILIILIKKWLNDIIKNKYSVNNGYYFNDYKETLFKFNSKFQNVSISKIFQILESIENYNDRNLNLNVLYLNLIFELASLSIRI